MPSKPEPIRVNDRIQWQDDEKVYHTGYVVADLSIQYLVRPNLSTNEGECFVFKKNNTLKRAF